MLFLKSRDVVTRSGLCDEAISKRSVLSVEWETAYPSGTLRGRQRTPRSDMISDFKKVLWIGSLLIDKRFLREYSHSVQVA